jgi:hypothetical protein
MREDMSKVVIERPREGHDLPSRKTRLRIRRYDPDKEYDDLPSRVSGSRSKYIRPREIKDFSDLLGPLRRFLRKNVGRPWNLVYSEMKEILDDRKVTGRHVFEHVEMEVETHALIGDDGELYKLGYGGRVQPIYEFYVDPRTGLLSWSDNNPPWRQRRKLRKLERDAQEVNRVLLGVNTCYSKLNGIWYFIEYEISKMSIVELFDHDQDEEIAPFRRIPEVSDRPILILRKKQLSHKELKTARLKNDHPLAVKAEVNQR